MHSSSKDNCPSLGVHGEALAFIYWATQLNKNELDAHQLSKRGGKLNCSLANERVLISGDSVIYFEGAISIV